LIIAADVNCTGVITAYDASLILQYIVGLLPAFPCPDPWVWYRFPCGGCVTSCGPNTTIDVIGLLKGNVSGRPGGGAMLAGPSTKVKLGIPEHFDDYVEVPVEVVHADDICSAQFNISYDPADFDVVEVRAVGLASGFMAAYHAEGGDLIIAMAGSQGFSGVGDVAVVRFQKKHTPMAIASTRLEVTDALLNEFEPLIEDSEYRAEVVRFGLGPISPNPFVGSTLISYSAAQRAHVSIDIYNVSGQLVRTVVDGDVEAGTHQVSWDGCDSSGSKVARGVYFCRMNSGQYNTTEKVVLLQ
jgi:hypothetical protein